MEKNQKIKSRKTNVKTTQAKKTKKSFFKEVKAELKKVKWPEKQEVIKYTIATIVFVIILVALFMILNLGMSVIKGLF